MSQEKTIKINVDAKEAIKQVDELKHGVAATDEAAVGSKHGFAIMKQGIRGVSMAFKALGIGLIVSGFVALKTALGENQIIMDKFNIASSVVGDIFQKLVNTILSVVKGLGLLGKAVGKVLRGEFKEAGEIAKQSFDGVKEAVVGNNESFSDFINNAKESAKESVKVAKAMNNMRNEVKLADAQQRQLQLTYQRDAELQRQLRDDTSLTFEERIAANEELGRILDEQFSKEQELANKKIALAELELSRNKNNIDLQVALIDAKTELADLEERITGQRSEQLTNLNSLEKEYQDSLKTTEKVVKETAKEEIAITKLTQEQKAGIISGALGQISGALGENSKAGKSLAIAQALIDTYTGANKALAQGGIFGAISAAGIVAAGLANVARIKSTNPETGAGGGGGGGADTNVPQPTGLGGAGLIPNLENINQNDLGTPEPVQAFVVENDISNAQALQEELEIQATL
jgi:hypothetical protein